jgi:hypothetical protein
MTTLPIPRLYWDTFESALQAHVRRLAKDVATCLGQDEKPLLKALLTEKTTAYLFEEEGQALVDLEEMRCPFLVASSLNPEILERCRQPILLPHGRYTCCPSHEGHTQQIPPLLQLRSLTDEYALTPDNIILSKVTLLPHGMKRKKCIILVPKN